MFSEMLLLAAVGTAAPLGMPAENVERIAIAYAKCAGLWDGMAVIEAAEGNANAAEQFRNTGNGAQSTALWLLSVQHNETHPEDKRRAGAFLPMVEPHRETGRTHFLAIVERQDTEALKAEVGLCQEMLSFQEDTVNTIRRQAVEDAAAQESAAD